MTTTPSEGPAGSALDAAVEQIAHRIADLVREAMELRMMRAADVIRKGVDHATIEGLLAAHGLTKLRTLVRVADALDCDVIVHLRLRGPK